MKRSTMLMTAALAVAVGFGAAARAEIVVAVVGPMSGKEAAFGEQMRRGAEMAIAHLNAAAGVLGQKLKLEIGDDRCDPKEAVAVANQMVGKKVRFVAGHFCSGSSIPASRVYNEEGIVQISPASTNPQLTEQGFSNVFRVCGRDDQQGKVAGDFLADRFKGKRIAILHDKTAYGKGLADETKKALNAKGVTEALYEAYTAGEKDYGPLVSKMKQSRVDAVYVGGYHTEAGLITRQMREQGMDAQIVSGDAMVTNEYWAITGNAGQGALMTFSPDPRKNPANAQIVDQFRRAGGDPEGYTLYTYGAIQAWVQAVTKAAKADSAAVIAALRGNQFETVLGRIGFDRKGDVTAPGYVFYQWKDGKYDYYTP
ncbi:MAG: branched-chain amino acid ABC transporter substrate-binding protein [Alphaproteobacteria bacterium]|nr:branched-chain amino acid ABC transporter substrate-binding protein [Alphaproteobacteria bacterium]